MADFNKAKGTETKSRFGSIPTPEEAGDNLSAPEHAPSKKPSTPKKKNTDKKARAKTGRTIPFGTKVSQDFVDDFRETLFYVVVKKWIL